VGCAGLRTVLRKSKGLGGGRKPLVFVEFIWRIKITRTIIALIACLAFPFWNIFAQSVEKDPAAIVELGGATSWNVEGGAATFAPDLAVEVTPIENWLELELGTTPFFTRNSTEWETDLLF
jgi:hypothetical protein